MAEISSSAEYSAALPANTEAPSGKGVSFKDAQVKRFFEGMRVKIDSNTFAREYASWWQEKMAQEEQRLKTAPDSMVGQMLSAFEKKFEFYATKVPEYVRSKLEPKLQEMITAGTISRDVAERFRKGFSKTINDPNIQNRQDILKYLAMDYEYLVQMHKENQKIKTEALAIADYKKRTLEGGSFTNSIHIFAFGDKKAPDPIYVHAQELLDKTPIFLDGKLEEKLSPAEFLQLLKKEKTQLEQEQRRRLELVQAGNGSLAEFKDAFQHSGWVQSLHAFAKSQHEFRALRRRAQQKGGIFRYYDHLCEVAEKNIKKAQKEGVLSVQKKRLKLEKNANWQDSREEHLALLTALETIPARLLTPELRAEKELILANTEKCLLKLKHEPFTEEIRQARLEAEKSTSPAEKIGMYQELQRLCQAHGLETAGIQNEYDLLSTHLENTQKTPQNSAEKSVGVTTTAQSVDFATALEIIDELLPVHAGRETVLLTLLARQKWDARAQGKEEQKYDLSAEELAAERAAELTEDGLNVDYGFSATEQESVAFTTDNPHLPVPENFAEKETALPGKLLQFPQTEKENTPREMPRKQKKAVVTNVVAEETEKIVLDRTTLARKNTRDLALHGKDLNAQQGRLLQFSRTEGGNTLRHTESRREITKMMRADTKLTLAAKKRGIDSTLLGRVLESRTKQITDVEVMTQTRARDVLEKVQKAAT